MIAGDVISKLIVLDIKLLRTALGLNHLDNNTKWAALVLRDVGNNMNRSFSLLHKPDILLRSRWDSLMGET